MIFEEYKTVFIGNPRTATDAFNAWCRENLEIHQIYGHDNLWYYEKTLENIHEYSFHMFVRNPFDRLVSWWLHHKQKNFIFAQQETFKEFVMQDTHDVWLQHPMGDPRPDTRSYWNVYSPLVQTNFIRSKTAIPVNIYWFENLEEEMIRMGKAMFDQEIHLTKRNETKRDNYLSYYDPETVNKVTSMLFDDMTFFGYKWGYTPSFYQEKMGSLITFMNFPTRDVDSFMCPPRQPRHITTE